MKATRWTGIILLTWALLALAIGEARQQPDDVPPGTETPENVAPDTGFPAVAYPTLNTVGHSEEILSLAFTPDGKRLVSTSRDKTVQVWDVDTGERLQVLRLPRGPVSNGTPWEATLSPDGQSLAFSLNYLGAREDTGRYLYLLSLADGKLTRLVRNLTADPSLAFSPDGKTLAWSQDQQLQLYDLQKHKQDGLPFKGVGSEITQLAFSPDGSKLAGVFRKGGVPIWDVATRQKDNTLHAPKARAFLSRVGWSRDGQTLLTTSNASYALQGGAIHVWDARTAKLRKVITADRLHTRLEKGPPPRIHCIQPVGDTRVFLHWNGTNQVGGTWSAGGLILDWSSSEVRQGFVAQEQGVHGGRHFVGAVAPDGLLAATSGIVDREITLWRPADGKVVRTLRGGAVLSLFHIGWSPDGREIAWGYHKDKTGKIPPFRVLDLAQMQLRGGATAALGPRYRGGQQKTLGALTVSHKKGPVLHVTGGPNPVDLNIKHKNGVYFSLVAGERVVVTSHNERTLQVFDAKTGKQLHESPDLAASIGAIAVPEDGRYVLVRTDRSLLVYDPTANKVLLSIFPADNEWIAWTPEGYYAASPGGERLMGWHVNNGPDQLGTLHPAARFRARLYRPDVIQRLLVEGSLEKALQAADKALGVPCKQVDVAQVLPPQVALTSPAGPARVVSVPGLEVKAEGRSLGTEPVLSLQLLLDDRPYQGDKGLVTLAQPKVGAVEESWQVELTPGPHRLRVLARTASSLGSSREVEVEYKAAAPRPTDDRPILYALCIGINNYPGELKLRSPVNDATALAGAFARHSQPLFRKVETKRVTNRDASKQGLLKELDLLKKQMTARDVAVVFFAGQGVRDRKGELYLLPQDGDPADLEKSAISSREIKKRMQELPGHLLVLLDASHSDMVGLLVDALTRDLSDEDCGVAVLCAATGKERSQEKNGQSFFTSALIEGLSGKAATNQRDGCVYLHHLEQYVIDKVQDLSDDAQHPMSGKPPSVRSFALAKP